MNIKGNKESLTQITKIKINGKWYNVKIPNDISWDIDNKEVIFLNKRMSITDYIKIHGKRTKTSVIKDTCKKSKAAIQLESVSTLVKKATCRTTKPVIPVKKTKNPPTHKITAPVINTLIMYDFLKDYNYVNGIVDVYDKFNRKKQIVYLTIIDKNNNKTIAHIVEGISRGIGLYLMKPRKDIKKFIKTWVKNIDSSNPGVSHFKRFKTTSKKWITPYHAICERLMRVIENREVKINKTTFKFTFNVINSVSVPTLSKSVRFLEFKSKTKYLYVPISKTYYTFISKTALSDFATISDKTVTVINSKELPNWIKPLVDLTRGRDA